MARSASSPTFLGARYRLSVEAGPGGEGARGKHRLHWRRGHFRQQAHGEGRALRKIIWIEPMLVGAET